MAKFTVGQKVIIKRDDRNRITDFQSDLMLCVEDRTISSRCRDAIEDAILTGKVFVITRIEDEYYEAKFGRYEAPFMFSEDDLTPA